MIELNLLMNHDQTKKLGTINIERKDMIKLMASDSVFFDPCFLMKPDGSLELQEISLCIKPTSQETRKSD